MRLLLDKHFGTICRILSPFQAFSGIEVRYVILIIRGNKNTGADVMT